MHMRFDQKKELEDLVFKHWFELRQEGRLDNVLPRSKVWSKVCRDGRIVGYDTREHKLARNVCIHNGALNGGDGVAFLVETYFSFRRENDWGPNLHINVVDVKCEPLRVAHLAQLLRYVTTLRAGIYQLDLPLWCPDGKPFKSPYAVYVCGALLGTVVGEDVLLAEAMMEAAWPSIYLSAVKVGKVTIHPLNGLTIVRQESDERFPLRGSFESFVDSPEGASLVDMLMGSSELWSSWVKRCQDSKAAEMAAYEDETANASTVDVSSETEEDNNTPIAWTGRELKEKQ